MKLSLTFLALSATALLTTRSAPQDVHATAPLTERPDQAREFGDVAWIRDLDAGLARAEETGRPAFLLFQEVPGCSTCVNFGGGPLRHPLLVEAIEELFVPVAIRNNVGGAEREALRRFGEPTWNNPVVRFVDADGKDLLPRRDGVWTSGALVSRMTAALEAADREVPTWLRLVAEELAPGRVETAVFAMGCYWTGEARLGSLDGVVDTRAAWHAGREVVEVRFRPDVVSREALTETARGLRCADGVWGDELAGRPRAASASDQLYYLQRSTFGRLPLTELQARRVNGALGDKSDPRRFLSPRQTQLAALLASAQRAQLAGLARPADPTEGELADYDARLRTALAPDARPVPDAERE